MATDGYVNRLFIGFNRLFIEALPPMGTSNKKRERGREGEGGGDRAVASPSNFNTRLPSSLLFCLLD
jgi:hypothetical protein